jgi:hypothetical protein
MAFIKQFCGIIGGATNRPAAADYITYASNTDSLDTMLTSGYFNELSNDIYKNDRIWIFNETDWADCRVTSENGVTPVTIVPISSSEGDGSYYAIIGGPYSQYDNVSEALQDGKKFLIIAGSCEDVGNIVLNSTPVVIDQYAQWRITNGYISSNSNSFNLQINSYGTSQIRINNSSGGAIFRAPTPSPFTTFNLLTLNDIFIVNENEINNVTLATGGTAVRANGLKWYETGETNGCGIHTTNDDDFYDNIEFIANQSETYNVANFGNSNATNIKFKGSFSGDVNKPSITTGSNGKLTNLVADISTTTIFSASLGGNTVGVYADKDSPLNVSIQLQPYATLNSVYGASVFTSNYCICSNANGIFNTHDSDTGYILNNIISNAALVLRGSFATLSNYRLNTINALSFNATNSVVTCGTVGTGVGFGGIILSATSSGVLSSSMYGDNLQAVLGTQVQYLNLGNVQFV